MNLFELDEMTFLVKFAPQALLIKEFKEIWECDRSKDKFLATKELGYVYYMADERSDYMHILDENERSEQVALDLELGDKWIEPKYIAPAIEKYKELAETTSTKLLQSTRNVVQKISHFLDVIDPNERDKNDKPVFAINAITRAVSEVPKLVKALNDIEKEIVKEKALKAQSGNKEIGLFDDNNGI